MQRRMRNEEGTVYQESSIQSEKIKKDEREKYLAYYEEIISDMIENGVSEEEAVAHQGETKKSQKKFCGKMQLKESSKLAG